MNIQVFSQITSLQQIQPAMGGANVNEVGTLFKPCLGSTGCILGDYKLPHDTGAQAGSATPRPLGMHHGLPLTHRCPRYPKTTFGITDTCVLTKQPKKWCQSHKSRGEQETHISGAPKTMERYTRPSGAVDVRRWTPHRVTCDETACFKSLPRPAPAVRTPGPICRAPTSTDLCYAMKEGN